MDHAIVGGIINSLPIDKMVSAPVMAAVKAQKEISFQLAEYINSVGLDDKGQIRTVSFNYTDSVVDKDGNPTKSERSIQAPFLALTGIPNFAMERVEVDFELEVTTAEEHKSSLDAKAETKVSGGFFGAKFEVTGSVAHHSEQTRKTDTRAKYSFKVLAQRQEPPESLMRVLDIMTNSLSAPAEGFIDKKDTNLIDNVEGEKNT